MDSTNIIMDEDLRSNSSSPVRKASSFNEKSTRRKHVKKRNTYTVPSDKEEKLRFEKHHQECLSKAIKWNTVDLVKHCSQFRAECHCIRNILTQKELSQVLSLGFPKSQFRMFLLFLQRKSFDDIKVWLRTYPFDVNVIQKVWKTYTEFSDRETNEKKMKCFVCRLSSYFPVICVSEHLYTVGIIDEDTYKDSFTTEGNTQLQLALWQTVLRQCNEYPYHDQVVNAIEIALADAVEQDEAIKSDVKSLLSEVQKFIEDPTFLINCYFSKICLKSLHPPSCVKTMPVTQIYCRKEAQDVKGDNKSMDSPHSCKVINAKNSPDPRKMSSANPESDTSSDSTHSPRARESYDSGGEADCDSLNVSPYALMRKVRNHPEKEGKAAACPSSNQQNVDSVG